MGRGRNIWHDVTGYVRERAPREIHNDDVATALGLSRKQVRSCMTKRMKDHPEDGFVESRPWVYTHVESPAKPHFAGGADDPVAAAFAADREVNPGKYADPPRTDARPELPAVGVRRGGVRWPTAEDITEAARWELLRFIADDDALLLDTDANVWRARRLS